MTKRPIVAPRQLFRISAGLSLVLVAVCATFVVVDSRGATRSVMIAEQELVPGSPVLNTDVTVVELAEDSTLNAYFSLQSLESVEGLVVNREIRAGELLRRDDFVEPSGRHDSVLTVSQSVGQPQWLARGQLVQVWVAPPVSENAFSAPFILSPEAVIARVSQDEGFAANGQESLVDLRVPTRDVPALIHALANRYFVHLAPLARAR